MGEIEDTNSSIALNNYEYLFEHHLDAICVVDENGNIVYANQFAKKIFDFPDSKLPNVNYSIIASPSETETFHFYFRQALDGKANEFTLVVCKGKKKVQVTVVPNVWGGQVVAVTVYMKDISKQNKHELETVQRDLCKSFIENNRDPILLLDVDATIVLSNPAFSKLLGWQKENLEGFHILSCPSIPTHLIKQMRDYYESVVTADHHPQSASHADLSTLETIRVTNDEKAYHMMLSITPIFDSYGEVCNWAVHLRDITVQKEAERSLLRAEKLLVIGQIAAGVAHEIRNPLQSLKGLTQLINNSRGSMSDYDQYLDVMLTELNYIETFVHEFALLGRTKLESYQITDVTHLIEDIIQSLKTETILRNVTIDFQYEEVPGICCEEGLLKQALFNVIENGIEAMQNGGTLNITIKSNIDKIEVRVVDYGVGIHEERIPKLGEPFYSNREKGFGLGLMLTYKIIEQHRGEITIESKVGDGTQVTISFPVSG